MPKVNEIKTYYGEQQAKILTELFDLGTLAKEVDVAIMVSTRGQLSDAEFTRLRAAEGAAWAEEHRDQLKTKYVELDMELRAAIEIRLEEVERELSPKDADFRDYAAAASATPEALIASMDIALASGDEDAALVAFAAGRHRDLEHVIAHATTVNERWGDLYNELVEAASDLGLDADTKFETLAPKAPSKEAIFDQIQSDINVYGQMR
jgi:hypothetical protein